MASGDTLAILHPRVVENTLSGGTYTSSRGIRSILVFPDGPDTFAEWQFPVPRNYSGNGVIVRIHFGAGTVGSAGNVVVAGHVERTSDGSLDLDNDGYGGLAASDVLASPAGTTLTSGDAHVTALDDGLVAGDWARVRVFRVSTDALDTDTRDMQLHRVEIREA